MTDLATEYERFARAALPLYGLEGATVTLLSVSENGTFLVQPASHPGSDPEADPVADPVVLRVHRPGYHSLAAIESELDWTQSLRQESAIRTPEVIPARDGHRVVEVRRGDDVRLVDVFSFVPGVMAEDDETAISFRELGAINAALHEHVHRWRPPASFTRFRWDLASMTGPAARWGNWRDSPGLDEAGRAIIEASEQKIIHRLTAYGDGPERFGLIHADLRMSNLMIDQGQITVIDFDDCGWSWFLGDLGAVVSWIEDTPRAREIVEEWLDGYQQVRPIPATDLAEVPTFVMLRRLMLTAWIGTHPESEPARRFGDHFATGTATLAAAYLNDPAWFDVTPN